MSDEQRQQDRDDAAAGASPQQHPVPAYLGGPPPQQPYAQPTAQQAAPSWATAGSRWEPQPQAGAEGGDPSPYASRQGAGSPYPSGPGAGPYAPGAGAGSPGAGASPAYGEPVFGPPPPPSGGGTAVIERPRPGRGRTGIVIAALLAGLVGGAGAGAGTVALLDRTGSSGGGVLSQSPSSSGASNAAPGSVAAAAAKAMPSTVDIQVALSNGTSEGTGVILTADGNVLTNNHVVAGNTGKIVVTLSDGSEHDATVVGTSPSYDLAVIKLQGASGLTPATLGRSADLQVGQQVVAIGSPQGLTGTVTDGIVSAFNRTVSVQAEDGSTVVYNGLQTDAAINPGNSGGPLINLDGQVVGINSAILSSGSTSGSQGGSIGLGFSIPIDQATRVAQEIMKTGTATKPVLGVTGRVTGGQGVAGSGAQIDQVQAGSPAAAAGLKSGDVVTKVGDAKVEDFADLIARIGANAPGAKVTLTIGSGSAARTVDVTLGSQPDKAASTAGGGQSTSPFGGGQGNGQGGNGQGGNGQGGGSGSPFGQNPFGGGN